MPLPATVQAQTDFSAGEVDVTVKRSEDSDAFKRGLRQCANFRITDTGKLANRMGRSAKFLDGPRVDDVLMSAGNAFLLCFGNQTLTVRNAAGAAIFTAGMQPWFANQVGTIAWAVVGLNIYICFGNTQPQVLTWDGVTVNGGWSLAPYAEAVSIGSQKRTFFYRISPQNITMQPSGTTGGINITFSANVLVPGLIGTRMRFAGRQILITGVTNPTTGAATVEETLFPSFTLTFSGTPAVNTVFSIGDEVQGSISGAQGIVTTVGTSTCVVQMINADAWSTTTGAIDDVVGPGGDAGALVSVGAAAAPTAISVWDDEVMNTFRGWPSFVFADQGRLGFCNFPSVPAGIGWSAIGNYTDLYAGATPDNAIFEIAPGKSQVMYALPGAESSEFIFCDSAIFYIPITAANPLTPSNVSFQKISGDGVAAVQPRLVQEAIVYISAGGSTVRAITATGAYNRPYESRHISKLHDHLIVAPVAIAAPQATDPAFPERYIYVLNGNGTLAVGKVAIEDGVLKDTPGWVPWSGNGSMTWVAARAANVWFTTTYTNGVVPVSVAERLDASQYLDAAILVNNVPAGMAAPGGSGLGPLWWLLNGTCTVMDVGTRQMGLYNIDGNGNLIAQNFGGENLLSPLLMAGQAWTATAEPFIPAPGPGQDVKQRMVRRKVARFSAYMMNSTGFLMARLFSGPLTRTSPALGTVMNQRRVTTYNQDDDPTQPPPLREGAEFWRPSGRSYDPRVAIIKDTAGPLTIAEIGMEVSV